MSYKLVLEQPKWIRYYHWIHAIIILVKIFTGLVIAFPVSFLSFKVLRDMHFFFAYILLFWFIGRTYMAIITGDYKNIVPGTEDIKKLIPFFKYEFFLSNQDPTTEKYNPGQKIIFLTWAIAIVIQLITGFSLYDARLSRPLDLLLGGLYYIRLLHYFTALYFTTTVTLHLYLALISNLSKLKAIFTGYLLKKQPD